MNHFVKSAKQIKAIRKSCLLAAEAVGFGGSLLAADISTGYLDREIDKFIRSKGGISASLNYKGYPASTCLSVNEEACHALPSDHKILKNGDVIKVDVAVIVDGFYGDTCRTFTVGAEDPEIVTASLEALAVGMSVVKPGEPMNVIGKAIETYVKQTKFSIVEEMCGHGLGLNYHEPPQILHYFDPDYLITMFPMRAGQTFTIEPILAEGKGEVETCSDDGWTIRTKDRSRTAQFEHTVLVTKKGFEILTLWTQ